MKLGTEIILIFILVALLSSCRKDDVPEAPVISPDDTIDEVVSFMNTLPKSLRHNPFFIAETAKFYQKHNQSEHAAAIVKKSLSKQMNEHLLFLFGDIGANESQLKFAESLLNKHPHSPALLLCCGKLCLQLEL